MSTKSTVFSELSHRGSFNFKTFIYPKIFPKSSNFFPLQTPVSHFIAKKRFHCETFEKVNKLTPKQITKSSFTMKLLDFQAFFYYNFVAFTGDKFTVNKCKFMKIYGKQR